MSNSLPFYSVIFHYASDLINMYKSVTMMSKMYVKMNISSRAIVVN